MKIINYTNKFNPKSSNLAAIKKQNLQIIILETIPK